MCRKIMKIEVNVKKKYFFSILAAILIVGGILAVYAYVNPATKVGHDISEIDPVALNGFVVNATNVSIRNGLIDDYIASLSVAAVNCPSTADYDSIGDTGVSNKPGRQEVLVNLACMSAAGCAIKQEIYNNKALVSVRYSDYIQFAGGFWTSDYQSLGTIKNGDSTSTKILPSYGSDIQLYDDDSGTETDALKWTARDTSSSYGQKIYVCTYN